MKQFVMYCSIFITLVLVSCATTSSFSNFYKPLRSPEERGYNVIRLNQDEEPRIILSNNLTNDLYDYLSRRYIILGKTSFNGPSEEFRNDIKMQCKKIGATVALYSIEYTHTNHGSIFYEGTGGAYSIRRYDYSVYYLVAFIDDVGFGANLVDLDEQTRQQYRRNTGAFVHIVYVNTPAFYANIIRGDIIISINDNEILDSMDAFLIIDNFSKGEQVNIEVIRDYRIETIEFTF
jgi:hypothetical protein